MWRLLCLLFPVSLLGQSALPQPGSSEAYFKYVISALAHDSMEGRLPGTPAEKKSAAFITNEFKRIGCQPISADKFTYPFSYYNPDSLLIQSEGNVIAKIETKSNRCIIVGAHYDHIGLGKYHSRAPFSKAIHNGADDNASGVAMMLAMANWCWQHQKELNYDMVFVAYAGEEDGLFGSKDLLKGNDGIDTATIYRYLNFDMLGQLNSTTPILKIEGIWQYPELDTFLMADSLAGFNVRKVDPIFKDGSDNYTFETHHIAGLSFTTGITEQYHKPNDDADIINYKGMVAISKYLSYAVKQMQMPEVELH